MLRGIFALALFLAVSGLHADWKLDSEASSLSFVTIKNGLVIESHHFNGLTGNVNLRGHAELRIKLASVDTASTQWDDRMEKHLFETARYSTAVYAVDLNLTDITLKLKAGDTASYQLAGVLNLHGVTSNLPASVAVSRMTEDAFQVTSEKPVLVSAMDFNLSEGLVKLRELAGLESITPMVAVSFNLVFKEYEFLQN